MFSYLSFKDSEEKGAWNNLSSALEIGAKIYGWRVDSVFTHTYKLLGGLNRGNKDESINFKSFFLFSN